MTISVHAPSAAAPEHGPARSTAAVHAETVVSLDSPVDLGLTLGPLQRGRGDPALRIDASGAGAWICRRAAATGLTFDPGAAASGGQDNDNGTARQAVTLRYDQLTDHDVRVRAWAESTEAAEQALREAPGILGANDDWSSFDDLLHQADDPISAALHRVRRRHPGLRLPAAGQLTEQLVTVVLEQKVTHDQARSCWRQLLRTYGEQPPGPTPEGMRVPPTPKGLRGIPSWQWHRLWVQPPLARTLLQIVSRESALRRLECTSTRAEDVADLALRLTQLPGIGPWTAAETLQRTHGAADLVSVGDYHLAHVVGEALTGRRTDDAGMLRLLEPWSGHRQRVVRLIGLSGFRPTRYGPKLAPEDHRRR